MPYPTTEHLLPAPTDFPRLSHSLDRIICQLDLDTAVGKTYIGFRLQALAKALELKEFQIWQLPCSFNHCLQKVSAISWNGLVGNLHPL